VNAASYNEQFNPIVYFMQKNVFEVYFFIRKICAICGVLNLKDKILILVLEEERCVSLLSPTKRRYRELYKWPERVISKDSKIYFP